jgi:hypothetical protein
LSVTALIAKLCNYEVPQHTARLVEPAISVVLAHANLLQEVVIVHARDLKRNLVILVDGVLGTQFDKTWLCGIVIRLGNLNISGVREREVPVASDRRRVLSVKLLIENTPVAWKMPFRQLIEGQMSLLISCTVGRPRWYLWLTYVAVAKTRIYYAAMAAG